MSSMKIELSTIGRTHVQWDDMGQHHTVRIALAPDDLAILAAANGYIHLGPGQVVVHRATLEQAKIWAFFSKNDKSNADKNAYADLTAALDASGVGK